MRKKKNSNIDDTESQLVDPWAESEMEGESEDEIEGKHPNIDHSHKVVDLKSRKPTPNRQVLLNRQTKHPSLPSIEPRKIFRCSLDGALSAKEHEKFLDIYTWEKDVDDHQCSILIVHDLWEDLSYYETDILWWLNQNRRVYGINMAYDGTYPDVEFPMSFQRMCIHFMQVLAHIRSIEDMTPPIVYTKGLGALLTAFIARKNAKFVSGMIAYAPMFFLAKPINYLHWFALKTLRFLAPRLMLARFYIPGMVELSQLPNKRGSRKISTRAIYEYLRAMKRAKKVCVRLQLPSLFILPQSPKVQNYSFLYEVQERFNNFMRFQMCQTAFYPALRDSVIAENDFNQFAENIFLPWVTEIENTQRSLGALSIPEDNALPPDDLTASLTSLIEEPKKLG